MSKVFLINEAFADNSAKDMTPRKEVRRVDAGSEEGGYGSMPCVYFVLTS